MMVIHAAVGKESFALLLHGSTTWWDRSVKGVAGEQATPSLLEVYHGVPVLQGHKAQGAIQTHRKQHKMKIKIDKIGNKFYFSINGIKSPSSFFSAFRAREYAKGIIARGENLEELIRQGKGK